MTSWAGASRALISVEDHGIGISESDQSKIFDRLYRGDRSRTQRGLGLGLSFVKAIITAHGGTIDVKSDINQGATFTVSLPKIPKNALLPIKQRSRN